MRYVDYTQPVGPHAVIGGKLVPLDDAAIAKLAMNAMLLSLGGKR